MSISYDVCEGTLSDGGLGRSFAALSASDLASGASVGVRVAAASASARRALARVMTCASWHAAVHCSTVTPSKTSGPSTMPASRKPCGTPRKPEPMMTLMVKHVTTHGERSCCGSSKAKIVGNTPSSIDAASMDDGVLPTILDMACRRRCVAGCASTTRSKITKTTRRAGQQVACEESLHQRLNTGLVVSRCLSPVANSARSTRRIVEDCSPHAHHEVAINRRVQSRVAEGTHANPWLGGVSPACAAARTYHAVLLCRQPLA